MIKRCRRLFNRITAVIFTFVIVASCIFSSGALTVCAEGNGTVYASNVIVGAVPLNEGLSDIHLPVRISEESLKSIFPGTLDVIMADGRLLSVPVSWESAEDYSEGRVYFYVYDPVIEGYMVSEDAELPYIVVWIDEASDRISMLENMVVDDANGAGETDTADVSDTSDTTDDSSNSSEEQNSVSDDTDSNSESEDTDPNSDPNSDPQPEPEPEPEPEPHLQDLIRDVQVDRSANEIEIYNYLRNELGLNEAASVGVLANINAESGYRQNALGDKDSEGYYTSYGICQWHNSRWENLINFGIANDVDWQTIHGQMMYLQYELEHGYKRVLDTLRSVENTEEGAYQAAYEFCRRFEVPANTLKTSDARGRVARDKFWPRFGGYFTPEGDHYIWRSEDGHSYWYENDVRQGTYDDENGVMGDGTIRGREIYDPLSDGWYWLDAVYDGAKAVNKEVWMPYIYSNEDEFDEEAIIENASRSAGMEEQVIAAIHAHGGEGAGKWVRYDSDGRMIKGWYTVGEEDAQYYPDQVGNTYYYDPITGLMAKGTVVIDGQEYSFDEVTGVLLAGAR